MCCHIATEIECVYPRTKWRWFKTFLICICFWKALASFLNYPERKRVKLFIGSRHISILSWKILLSASTASLCAIVHLFQRNSLRLFSAAAVPEQLLILQIGVSECALFFGSFKVECAVLQLGCNVAAISGDATANAIFFSCLSLTRWSSVMKYLHVLPSASRKKMTRFRSPTLSVMDSVQKAILAYFHWHTVYEHQWHRTSLI